MKIEVRSQMFVQTKTLPATDRRGTRIKATNMCSGKSVTIAWDDEFNPEENHAAAARALYVKLAEQTGQLPPVKLLASDTRDSSGYYFTDANRLDIVK